jgi:hypothetical protein
MKNSYDQKKPSTDRDTSVSKKPGGDLGRDGMSAGRNDSGSNAKHGSSDGASRERQSPSRSGSDSSGS